MNFNRKSENLLNAVGRVHTFILYRKYFPVKYKTLREDAHCGV